MKIHFKINYHTHFGQSLYVCGSLPELGQWYENEAVEMQYADNGNWTLSIETTDTEILEYYYLVKENGKRQRKEWGFPHKVQIGGKEEISLHDFWQNWRAEGVAIPVFSLRSEQSFGIGEFSDLKLMIDWAKTTGMKVIQTLPINDTTITHTWTDSYPYNAISIYALHPVYLGLHEFPLKNQRLFKQYKQKAVTLNQLEAIDYESVIKLKESYIRDLFKEQGDETFNSQSFKDFFAANESWLFPYACFTHFRDKYRTADYTVWGECNRYDKDFLAKKITTDKQLKENVDLAYFTQYLLHNQLIGVKKYAEENNVILKGDIPIGVSRAGVETWVEPHLFNLDAQTGAPPDDFSITGQNWGFPTYNWDEMAKDGYRWWIKRFRKMADYFGAYRIDHILGFFRIWEIPLEYKTGLMGCFSPAMPFSMEEIESFGFSFDEKMTVPNTDAEDVLFIRDKKEPHKYHPRITAQTTNSFKALSEKEQAAYNHLYEHFFYHRHNDFWSEQAMKKLPALISSTNMLTCGEDLGMIPDCVPSVMNELQILSLEIQRMPKVFGVKFTDLNTIPYLSVCTTSTHDMSPIRFWWTENEEVTQQFYNEVLHRQGNAPQDCTPELCRQILANHLQSPAMLAIIPLQDWLAVDATIRNPKPEEERINIPANPQHYWRYRMHLTLEELMRKNGFSGLIKNLLENTGR